MFRGDTRRWRHGKLLGNKDCKRDGCGRIWGRPGLGKLWRLHLHKALRRAYRMEERILENRTPDEALVVEESNEDMRASNKSVRIASIVDWKDT
jgi:hypothetical protein